MSAIETYRRERTIRNPITDRALRYRANATPPEGPKQCAFCGSRENVEVGHLDGHEENTDPSNLIWTCRSCNVLSANTLRAAGLGRKTRQYNPKGKGAKSVSQWALALMSMRGQSDAMSVKDALDMVYSTPPEKRSDYNRQLWRTRKQRYGSSGRGSEVPF